MENRALGKGLSALIPEKTTSVENVKYVKTELVKENRLQPRTNYNDAKLEELKNSIKDKGVLQPILVREKNDGYEVIAGERRLRAARSLKMEEVPVIIKSVSDHEALVIALIENIQREELNPIEVAQAYRRLIDEFQYSQDSVAEAVRKDRSTVSNTLRILKLSQEIQKSVYDGALSFGHARALLGVESETERKRLFELTIKKGISVRELESLVKTGSKSAYRREKAKTTKHPQLVTIEDGLQKLLGTKVRVEAKKKRGKIIIEFYSLEDLNRIVKLMIKA